jgi:hypothetical protein
MVLAGWLCVIVGGEYFKIKIRLEYKPDNRTAKGRLNQREIKPFVVTVLLIYS